MRQTDGRGEAVVQLHALVAELAARGWAARVCVHRGRAPCLYASNPEPGAAALSEHIYVGPRADGTWVYWWPWSEPIAETAAEAAAVIVHVLRPSGVS